MTRGLTLASGLLLAACGSADPAPPAPELERIECAIANAADFERTCTIEREKGPEGLILIIRAPSGSFRRLLVTGDGRGVMAADGAEPAIVAPVAERMVEVRIAGDRYRLPATVKAQ